MEFGIFHEFLTTQAGSQQEAFRKNGAVPREDIPELRIPKFLQKGPNGSHPEGPPN